MTTKRTRSVGVDTDADPHQTLLRDIVNASPAVLYLSEIEPPYRTLFVTEGISRQLGYSPSEVIGVPNFWLDRVHPDDRPLADDAMDSLLRTGQAYIECRVRRKDGEYRWIADESKLLKNQSGVPEKIVGSCLDITERKHAEAELQESNRRLRTIIERLPFGMICASHEGQVAEFMNQAFTEITGYGMDEAGTFEDAIERLIPLPERRAEAVQNMQKMVAEAKTTGRPSTVGLERFVRRDGSPCDAEVQFVDLDGIGIWTFRDSTKRIQAEERVQRLSMLKDALSAINRAIVRMESEEAMFQEACVVAVDRAGCLGAWIGILETETHRLRPVAAAGIVKTGAREPSASGAVEDNAQAAIASPTTVIRDDFLNVTDIEDGPDLAEKYDVGSGAAFPLFAGSHVYAVFTVYHAEVDAYDPETVALFEELADDISFALAALKTEREREIAEQSLLESENRFRSIVEQTISGIYIIDQQLRFIYVNPRFAQIFGYETNDEVSQLSALDVVAPESHETVLTHFKRRFGGEVRSARFDFVGMRRDGTRLTVGAHGTIGTYSGEPVVIGTLQDVTEVRRAEAQLRDYVGRLERTTVSTINIISVIGELRDPYTHGHEGRVGELAAAIGGEMGLDHTKCEGLRIIGHLHDVGKIAIPAEILAKPTKLSAVEYELVKGHARQGYEILKGYEFPWPVAQAVLQHHERLDGSGYPQGLDGHQIMLEARILAVADTVEAMSSHRPYRAGLGLEAALAEIEKGTGMRYDSAVVAACLRLFREKGYQISDWQPLPDPPSRRQSPQPARLGLVKR